MVIEGKIFNGDVMMWQFVSENDKFRSETHDIEIHSQWNES